jgi:hypothetical protein
VLNKLKRPAPAFPIPSNQHILGSIRPYVAFRSRQRARIRQSARIVVERAFQIAKSGKVANVSALRAQLSGEGYSNSAQALAGRSISNQLSRLIVQARNG